MSLDQLKRWHWCAIGAIAGLMVGVTRPGEESAPTRRSIEPANFEALLLAPDRIDNVRPLTDIKVYPLKGDRYSVEFDELMQTKQGEVYVPRCTDAQTPYTASVDPPPNSVAKDHPYTIVDHLNRLQARYPNKFSYAVAWWAAPRWACAIWMAGGLVVAGGIWPMLLNILTGAGFRSKKKMDQRYDLSRFGMRPQAKTPAFSELPEELRAEVDEFNTRLKNDLSDRQIGDPSLAAAMPIAPLEVKTLPDDVQAPEIRKEEEQKEYEGEFYPTERIKPHRNDAA